eukprot:1007082_1
MQQYHELEQAKEEEMPCLESKLKSETVRCEQKHNELKQLKLVHHEEKHKLQEALHTKGSELAHMKQNIINYNQSMKQTQQQIETLTVAMEERLSKEIQSKTDQIMLLHAKIEQLNCDELIRTTGRSGQDEVWLMSDDDDDEKGD